jgi:hypothetical protein
MCNNELTSTKPRPLHTATKCPGDCLVGGRNGNTNIMSCDDVNLGDTGPSPNLFDGSHAPLMAQGLTHIPVLVKPKPEFDEPEIATQHELEH